MKRLQLYMIKSFIGPFFVTLFISIFVLLMQFLWKYLDDFVGKGLEFSVIGELMLYASASLIPMALPLAMLLASIMTFGDLGETNELLAMKAAGISLLKIMRPLVYLSFFITIFAFYFSNEVLPVSNRKFLNLLQSVRQQRPEMIIKEGVFSNDMDGYSIKVEEKSKTGNMLYSILVYDHKENKGNVTVTVADSGVMEISNDKQWMIFTLYSGETYTEVEEDKRGKDKTHPYRRELFNTQVLTSPLRGMDFQRRDENSNASFYKFLPIDQLSYKADSLGREIDRNRTDYSSRKMNYLSPLNRKLIYLARNDSFPDEVIREKPVSFDSIYSAQKNTMQQEFLKTAIDEARNNQKTVVQAKSDIVFRSRIHNKHWIEWHKKFTFAVACFVFFFIGAPLGAIIRKGGLGLPLIISVLLFIFYYIVSITAEKFSREGVYTVWEGMWFSTIMFMPAGFYLTYKAANDSAVFNSASYIAFFKKINPFKKKSEEKE